LASKVVFHGKPHPWYVSDVTSNDFNWVLNTTANSDDFYLSTLGKKWKTYVEEVKNSLELIIWAI
jgi:hypothetical protein